MCGLINCFAVIAPEALVVIAEKWFIKLPRLSIYSLNHPFLPCSFGTSFLDKKTINGEFHDEYLFTVMFVIYCRDKLGKSNVFKHIQVVILGKNYLF